MLTKPGSSVQWAWCLFDSRLPHTWHSPDIPTSAAYSTKTENPTKTDALCFTLT